jgi:hypothetical protein
MALGWGKRAAPEGPWPVTVFDLGVERFLVSGLGLGGENWVFSTGSTSTADGSEPS